MKYPNEEITEIFRLHQLYMFGFKNGKLAYLHDLDLRDTNFSQFFMPHCIFVNCDLRGAVFRDDLEGCNFSGSNLENANFMGTNLAYANFTGCNLKDTNFKSTYMGDSILKNSNYEEAIFENTDTRDVIY